MEWVHCHIARQPVTSGKHLKDIPEPALTIILKLLDKTAEARYQTAAGVESDLRRCLGEWESHRRIDEFLLGAHNPPDRLLIPEKFYGRVSSLVICRIVNLNLEHGNSDGSCFAYVWFVIIAGPRGGSLE